MSTLSLFTFDFVQKYRETTAKQKMKRPLIQLNDFPFPLYLAQHKSVTFRNLISRVTLIIRNQ